MKRKVLLIGKCSSYHYLQMSLTQAGYQPILADPDVALDLVCKCHAHFDGIITQLEMEHGGTFNRAETEFGRRTGAVIIQKMAPRCPRTIFILLEGNDQRDIRENDRVRFMPCAENMKHVDIIAALNNQHAVAA